MKKAIMSTLFILFAVSAMAEKGTIHIDGSSTVFPLTEAIAEEFGKIHPEVKVMVGVSGTGGGFKKFTAGEIDIVDASRPIKDSEVEGARKNGLTYIEIPVAMDGITVVTNVKNTWIDYLTVEELKKIWSPNSSVKTWSQVRKNWPAKPIKLYGPGTDSGTFDYFTEVIVGKARASRSDYAKSEDDNVLVQGVQGDEGSLGYFGYSYYVANKTKLKAIPIQEKKMPILPTEDTILNGTYKPLSRPLYLYVNKEKLKEPALRDFMIYYLEQAPKLAKEVGFVPMASASYAKATDLLKKVIP